MKIVIIIPTYNEAQNIELLIPELEKQFGSMPHHEFHILVVDGNSPDGTGDIVNDYATHYNNVHLLLEQEKAGLGAAYFFGFKHAMNKMKADAVVEMDGDFQHRPEDLIKLIEAFDEGYDYVIGSRYLDGIDIPKEWAFYRKFLSVVGNWVTKIVLGIYNVKDFTTGFKLSRVKGFVDRLPFESINSSGFAYKIDLLFRMYQLDAKIKEVPIKFGVRDRGDSKMERDNTLDSLRVVFLLRYQKSKSFFKFLIVGVAGLFTDTLIFNILRITHFSSGTAAFVSGFFGMLTTFTLNNYWSFKERQLESWSKKATSFGFYLISSSVPIVFRGWFVGYFTGLYGDTFLTSNFAFLVGITFGLIWNYSVYSRIIWKRK